MENNNNTTHVRNWKNYLIGLLAIAVTVLWFTRSCDNPPPLDDIKETAYQDTIRVLRIQGATVDAKEDSVFASATDRIKRDSVTIKQMARAVAVARMREREAEAKVSALTKFEHPEVAEALEAKDNTIRAVSAMADSLMGSNYTLAKQLQALEHLDIDEDRIQAKMIQECEANREQTRMDLTAANREAEKVPLLKRVVTWLGVALVIETVVLIVKD